jgi:serine/threonine protein kinase/Tfp pilus assembly protein PilF
MDAQQALVDRPEVKRLHDLFRKKVAGNCRAVTVWLQGERGIGKTTVVKEFFQRLRQDLPTLHRIKGFDQKHDVIEADCEPAEPGENPKPYNAFVQVEERIRKRNRVLGLLKKISKVILSIFSIGDLMDSLGDLAREMEQSDEDEKLQKERIRLFSTYIKEIRRATHRRPIIIFLKHVEYMDRYSAQLLESLVAEQQRFYAFLILEQGDRNCTDVVTRQILDELALGKRIERLRIRPLNEEQVRQMIVQQFGRQLFNQEELVRIYALTRGIPSVLKQQFQIWKEHGTVVYRNGQWEATDHFMDWELKTNEAKFLENVRQYLLNDDSIDREEAQKLRVLATTLGIGAAKADELVQLVVFEQKCGLEVKYLIRSESFSSLYRAVSTSEKKEYLIEAIPGGDFRKEEAYLLLDARRENIIAPIKSDVQNGFVFLIHDYVEGKTLHELCHEAGVLDEAKALEVIRAAAVGLRDAYRKGVLHGRLRPESIMITSDNVVKVRGFGLGKIGTESSDGMHAQNLRAYLPPEALMGGEISCRNDIYSLGVILYELLAGVSPADRGFDQRLPARIQLIVNRSVDRDSGARYSSYDELIEDLEKALVALDEPRTQDPAEALDLPSRGGQVSGDVDSRSRRKLLAYGLTALTLLVVAFFARGPIQKLLHPVNIIPKSVAIRLFENDDGDVSKGMIEYLIQHDILGESGRRVVLLPSTWGSRNHDMPEVEITGKVRMAGAGFVVTLTARNNENGQSESKDFQLVDNNDLLESGIDNMYSFLQPFVPFEQPRTASQNRQDTFTRRWDSFNAFFRGEEAWQKLDNTTAQRQYTRAVQIDPAFGLAYLRLAQVHVFRQTYEDAWRNLDLAYKYFSSLIPVDTLRLRALMELRDGKIASRQYYLQKVATILKFFPGSQYELGESYFHAANAGGAIKCYEKAIELDSTFALAYNHLAYCYAYRGSYDTAGQRFRDYVRLDNTANAFDSYGDGLMFAGELDSALAVKRIAFSMDSTMVGTFGSLSRLFRLKGQYSLARKYGDLYLARCQEPVDRSDAYFSLAYLSYLEGKIADAETQCMRANTVYYPAKVLERNQNVQWLLGCLAYEKYDLQRLQSIVETMRLAIVQNDINQTNYQPVLKCYLDLRMKMEILGAQPAKAIETMREVQLLRTRLRYWADPFDFSFFMTEYSRVYDRLGHPKESGEVLKAALAYSPKYALAHFQMGRFLWSHGNPDQAKEAYKKFLDLWRDADPILAEVVEAKARFQ